MHKVMVSEAVLVQEEMRIDQYAARLHDIIQQNLTKLEALVKADPSCVEEMYDCFDSSVDRLERLSDKSKEIHDCQVEMIRAAESVL